MASIIVNADDYGGNDSINSSIEDAINRGLISSTSIISNGLSFDGAVRFAKKNRNVSYGIHLNLTRFQSLTKPRIFQRLQIMNSPSCKKPFPSNKISIELLQAIKEEWIAQIEKFIRSGLGLPSHIDSHQHVHTQPLLFFALKAVQKHFGIRKVRNTANAYPNISFENKVKKAIWSYSLKNIYKTRTTDYFLSYSDFVYLPSIDKDKTYELMCHPEGISALEVKLLGENAACKKDVRMITYNEL